MTDVSDGWPFLVARGRHSGFRTILAPPFLVEASLHHLLAESTGIADMGPDGSRIVNRDAAELGPISIGYTSRRVDAADAGATGQPPTDEHGRPLEIVYGIVSRNLIRGPLDAADLHTAGEQALKSYRAFLDAEDRHAVERSTAFALVTPIEARPADTDPADGGGTPPVARRPRPSRPTLIALAAAVLMLGGGIVLAVAPGTRVVRIYSSLPLHGPERMRSQDIERGMRLALAQAGGKAGAFAVTYESLDDSTAAARGWTAAAVRANAARAARDDDAGVYIGELSSAASAAAIPILSRARFAQISPANTALGLTRSELEAGERVPAGPYAEGFRNYARIVPRDTVQGEALAITMRRDGCTRVAVVRDRSFEARGLTRAIGRAATERGLRRVAEETVATPTAARGRSLATRIARAGPDCVAFGGATTTIAVGLFEALASRLPGARLYGGDGLAKPSFTNPDQGGLRPRTAARVRVTLPALGLAALGEPGRRFRADFAHAYGIRRPPDPYAVYGYEAMLLALAAIERSGTGERADIVRALFATQDRASVIGRYSIDRYGDTTTTAYALYAIRDGRPVFERVIDTAQR